jgi:hypothetical protein
LLRLVACASLLVCAAGCGGFSASQGISPATFLLPGLMKADPPQPSPELALPAAEPGIKVAQR